MKPLDPERLALTGTTVVEASAGTGKTYTITTLFVRLLLESELGVDQILVVTYTRAATAELRDRIRKRIALALAIAKGEPADDELIERLCARAGQRTGRDALIERLERALGGVDQAPVLTIHGFCQRVLRDFAFESGAAFEAQLTAHAGPLLDEIADDYFMRELYDTTPLRAEVLLDQPEPLRKLAARVSGPSVRVIPEHSEELAFDGEVYRTLLERCRELWCRDREQLVELVSKLKGVGQNAHKWASTVDDLLAVGDPVLFGDKASFVHFTRTGVHAKSRGEPPEHPFFDASDELLVRASEYKRAKQSIELSFRRRFVDYLQSELERRTRETSVRTFDSLLTDLDRALLGKHGGPLVARLRDKYRAALVDEFQDTDPTQYRIFRRIFAEQAEHAEHSAPLFLIGDPKQAIYGFRGADVAAYLGARADAGEQVYTLDVNYRSDPPLIEALNALYASVARPFALDEIAYQPVRAPRHAETRLLGEAARSPIDVALVASEQAGGDSLRRSIARKVANDIAALLASATTVRGEHGQAARLAASHIAVLCRTNNEAALVQLALSERGVPSVLSGDASVFDSDDVMQLERALTALAHPGDARALRSFLSSSYGGHDARAILELEDDDIRWDHHRVNFQRLHETWLNHGFMQALRGLMATYEVEQRLLTRTDGMRRITNLWHLAELLTEAAVSERLGPLGLLRWLRLVQSDHAQRSELVGDAHELRLESGDDAVTLTTVHKSKGLEYPLVYCPFLWDAARLFEIEKRLVRFHDPAHDDVLTLDLSADKAHVKIAESEALAEALRLLYVALTRAKHRITIVVPSSDRLAQSALGYTLFGGGEAASLQTRLGALIKDGALASELAMLAERLGAGLSVRELVDGSARGYRERIESERALTARPIRRALDQSYRVASFSALIARERTAFGEAGLDRDQVADEGEHEAPEPSTLALANFPRGALAGQLVHEVLEHADFSQGEHELSAVVERFVKSRGYGSELVSSLTQGLLKALHTPLDAGGFTLAQLSKRARIDELEFVFPIDSVLKPSLLARVFRAHRAPPARSSYASDLAALSFDALHGYLRGYIDLLFRHEGRFYVVDYKSNWLGPRATDYAPPLLPSALAEHHYFLQYHLYVVAVHRYLAQRVRDYDYERHFGGVYYLFLRGMAPEHAAQTGVFFDRPTLALVSELDLALRAPTRELEEQP
jgi:exodeoxyribonuclease V beta subunit